jgi:CxxC motif-containing protein
MKAIRVVCILALFGCGKDVENRTEVTRVTHQDTIRTTVYDTVRIEQVKTVYDTVTVESRISFNDTVRVEEKVTVYDTVRVEIQDQIESAIEAPSSETKVVRVGGFKRYCGGGLPTFTTFKPTHLSSKKISSVADPFVSALEGVAKTFGISEDRILGFRRGYEVPGDLSLRWCMILYSEDGKEVQRKLVLNSKSNTVDEEIKVKQPSDWK